MTHQNTTTSILKKQYNTKQQELHDLYQSVRNIREGKNTKFSLEAVFDILTQNHEENWLLALEIYELTHDSNTDFGTRVFEYLKSIEKHQPKIKHLISSGLDIISNTQTV